MTRLKAVRDTVKEELSLERKAVEEQRRIAEEQLHQVSSHLKDFRVSSWPTERSQVWTESWSLSIYLHIYN